MSDKVSSTSREAALEEANVIKRLIFTKTLEPYKIPLPPNVLKRYETFPCLDCGDRFLFRSSYNFHVNRKSMKITYNCQICKTILVLYNRCALLCHIRGHITNTITINLADINIETIFENIHIVPSDAPPESVSEKTSKNDKKLVLCPDCKVFVTGDFLNHYVDSALRLECLICDTIVGSPCAMSAHYRLHLLREPLICSECGDIMRVLPFFDKNKHKCKIVDVVKKSTYTVCLAPDCETVSFDSFPSHFKDKHLRRVYKCSFCPMIFLRSSACIDHEKKERTKNANNSAGNNAEKDFFNCLLCPGRLIVGSTVTAHIYNHLISFPSGLHCKVCGSMFETIHALKNHSNICSGEQNESDLPTSIIKRNSSNLNAKCVHICKQCNTVIEYVCDVNDLTGSSPQCPNCDGLPKNSTAKNCTDTSPGNLNPLDLVEASYEEESRLVCFCKENISYDWDRIKLHFQEKHQEHRCVDVFINLDKKPLDDLMIHSGEKNRLSRVAKERVITKFSSRCIKRIKRGNKRIEKGNKRIEKGDSKQGRKPLKRKNREWRCDLCNILVACKSEYEEHNMKQHSLHYCRECGKLNDSQQTLASHLIASHYVTNIEKYMEDNYGEKFTLLTPARGGKKRFIISRNKIENPKPLVIENLQCCHCGHKSDHEKKFRDHIMEHREINMSYQCMECGQLFAVKPSFTTHLLMFHSIDNVDEYIAKNEHCYNTDAIKASSDCLDSENLKPLKENQCKVCRGQYSNFSELDKHMRVHGMAYLEWKSQFLKTPSP